MTEFFFIAKNMTIPEMEEEKWNAIKEQTFEGAMYAIYLQHQIDQALKQSFIEMIQNLEDSNE